MCISAEQLSKISNKELIESFEKVNQSIGKTGDPFPKGPHDPELLKNEILRRLNGIEFKTKKDYENEILNEMHS